MRTRESRTGLAIQFFGAATLLLLLAAACAALLPVRPEWVGQPPGVLFPPIFLVSTCCLAWGSWSMLRAEYHVARERQPPFRRSLQQALIAGTGFVAVQSYALAHFLHRQSPAQAAAGATQFVAVAAALHGMHFLIAWFFLLFVCLQAHADRYDHEYYWGVTFCSWFWHALGIVWLAVLCVMAIAQPGTVDDGILPDPNLD